LEPPTPKSSTWNKQISLVVLTTTNETPLTFAMFHAKRERFMRQLTPGHIDVAILSPYAARVAASERRALASIVLGFIGLAALGFAGVAIFVMLGL